MDFYDNILISIEFIDMTIYRWRNHLNQHDNTIIKCFVDIVALKLVATYFVKSFCVAQFAKPSDRIRKPIFAVFAARERRLERMC